MTFRKRNFFLFRGCNIHITFCLSVFCLYANHFYSWNECFIHFFDYNNTPRFEWWKIVFLAFVFSSFNRSRCQMQNIFHNVMNISFRININLEIYTHSLSCWGKINDQPLHAAASGTRYWQSSRAETSSTGLFISIFGVIQNLAASTFPLRQAAYRSDVLMSTSKTYSAEEEIIHFNGEYNYKHQCPKDTTN